MTDESKNGLMLSEEDTTCWQKVLDSTDQEAVKALVSEAVEPARARYKTLIEECMHRQVMANVIATMPFSWMSFLVYYSSLGTTGGPNIPGMLFGVLPGLIMMRYLNILDERLRVQREVLVSDMKRLDDPLFSKLCFQYRILSVAKIKLATHFQWAYTFLRDYEGTDVVLVGNQQSLTFQTSDRTVRLVTLCEQYLQVTAYLLSRRSDIKTCFSTERLTNIVESIQILHMRARLMQDQDNIESIRILDEVGTNLLKIMQLLSSEEGNAQ